MDTKAPPDVTETSRTLPAFVTFVTENRKSVAVFK